ncbi:MAG: OsmC family protein [Chloroflexi bacterium]|nr:OsmC family protein [Chloroflexota bacterium]
MTIRQATATWKGTLKDGNGSMESGSGYFDVPFTFASRFEEGKGTNPEEMIGAAHAGCYSMFLSALLSKEGFNPTSIETTANVHLGKDDSGPLIEKIELVMEAAVPGLEETQFMELANTAKAACPISRALAAVPEMTLQATLLD